MRVERVIAARLRKARLQAGLSQERLGVLAGLDEMSASARMNQYEREKHVPGPTTVASIAAALRLPVSYFYEPDDEIADAILVLGEMGKPARRRALAMLRKSVEK